MRVIFLILFFILLVTWVIAWTTFHIAGALIHLLLIVALISLILHVVAGRRSA